jgi:hypothetical protein
MKCPYCKSENTIKRGSSKSKNKQRYNCKKCNRWFSEKNSGAVVEIKEKIVNWRDLSKLAKEHQKVREVLGFSCTEATATIQPEKGKDGVVIFPWSDQHIGGEGVDYDRLEEITEYIKQKNIYVIMGGDEAEFFLSNFKNATALFSQMLSPEEQIAFVESWFNELEPWIVSMSWGNHVESRLESLLGINFYGKIKSRIAPYFNGIGKLNLSVGNQPYSVVLTHKGLARSKYNPNYGAFDLARNKIDADIFVTAHYHEPAFSNFLIRNKPTVAIQCGTLNVNDDYSQRGFRFGQSSSSSPALFLSSKKRLIIPFEHIEDAIRFRDLK